MLLCPVDDAEFPVAESDVVIAYALHFNINQASILLAITLVSAQMVSYMYVQTNCPKHLNFVCCDRHYWMNHVQSLGQDLSMRRLLGL